MNKKYLRDVYMNVSKPDIFMLVGKGETNK